MSAKTLKDLLKEKTSGISPLTEGREKMTTDEILDCEKLTLSEVHLITSSDGEMFAVVVFEELPNGFYFSGSILTDIISTIYKYYDIAVGEPVKMSDIGEHIAVKAHVTISKNKRKYTAWTIVD
jgi:hypothetical protein